MHIDFFFSAQHASKVAKWKYSKIKKQLLHRNIALTTVTVARKFWDEKKKDNKKNPPTTGIGNITNESRGRNKQNAQTTHKKTK